MIKQNASNKDPNLSEQSHAVILLASGLSQRLGQPKQLLKKQSQPLLEVMTNLALATNPSAILLVVASSQSETIQLSQTLAAQNNVVMPVINTEPEQGMAHSLSLAIDTLTTKVAQGLYIERVLI
jgi:molybdenum cofactor cytidylyltransferase